MRVDLWQVYVLWCLWESVVSFVIEGFGCLQPTFLLFWLFQLFFSQPNLFWFSPTSLCFFISFFVSASFLSETVSGTNSAYRSWCSKKPICDLNIIWLRQTSRWSLTIHWPFIDTSPRAALSEDTVFLFTERLRSTSALSWTGERFFF